MNQFKSLIPTITKTTDIVVNKDGTTSKIVTQVTTYTYDTAEYKKQVEKQIAQIKAEQETKISDLQSSLDAVAKVEKGK